MKQILYFLALTLMLSLFSTRANAAEHPNILWLVCEDSNVTWFGCYGNPQASTPNIDAFAKQGFRYTHVYAAVPVCAPSRSTWITGVNAVSTGTLGMRSRYLIPHAQIKYYPDYLKQAGYYTANHSKTDFNIGGRPDNACWDSSQANAWALRKPGQPFFQIINYNESHESTAHGDVTKTKHSPADVTLAKYHPDELGIRQTYAKYYDAVEKMDRLVGKTLADLEKEGLADSTIVIFNSDHGGVMPRSKRFLYDSGLHCPMIIRIPEKYTHLWPSDKPGTTVDRLVSFVDFTKTWLSITGSEVPAVMQGKIFLGAKADAEPEFVFSFRERMDERFDFQRAVRNKRFLYIRNYMPYVPWGQHLDYLWQMAATRAWEDAYKNHRTDAVTGRFFETKPVEELYDMQADPDNVLNLASSPEHQETVKTMRAKLREWQLSVRDSGLLPEVERVQRAAENKITVYEMARDPKLYDLPTLLDAADVALARDSANKPKLIGFLASKDSGVRYWGTAGLLMLGKADVQTQTALENVLADTCGEVRCLAAWTLIISGKTEKAQQALVGILQKHEPSTLLALNVVDLMHVDIAPYADAMAALDSTKGALASYEERMVAYLFEAAGKISPPKTTRKAAKKNAKPAAEDK